ncbi:hypothetical protein ACFOGQ_18765 [Acinetobacter vivianii]
MDNVKLNVTAKCVNDTGFESTVISDLHGTWSGEVEQKKLPCKLKVVSEKDTYYSYVFDKDTFVNINPITTLVVALASQQKSEDWFNSKLIFTKMDLNKASEAIKQELIKKDYAIDQDLNLITDDVMSNSSYYSGLSKLEEAIHGETRFAKYSDLVDLVAKGQLNAIPAIPEDYARLKINYQACAGEQYQGSTKILTHCSSSLLPDFKSKKLRQKDKQVCEIQKRGDLLSIKSGQANYQVKINQQENDKITDDYPVMNTLLLAEGNQRVEILFQYDLLVMAAAYHVDSQGSQSDLISCDGIYTR